jgi:hypothetical protein
MTKPRPSTVDAFGLRHEPTTGPQAPGRLVPRVTEWKTGQPRKAKPRRSEPGELAGTIRGETRCLPSTQGMQTCLPERPKGRRRSRDQRRQKTHSRRPGTLASGSLTMRAGSPDAAGQR